MMKDKRWPGRCLDLAEFILPEDGFRVTRQEVAEVQYWPEFALLLRRVEEIARGEWTHEAGNKEAIDRLSGAEVRASWFDPRAGTSHEIGRYPNTGERQFTLPASGPDWVLVLDDASRGFPAPGSTAGENK